MASVVLPGAYPDSVPATPEETMQHQLQTEQHPRHSSKLYKPGDPRSHKYSDSGVGMAEQDSLTSSRPNRNQPDQAEGGGLYRRDNHEPIVPLESIQTEPDQYTPAPEPEGSTQPHSNSNDGHVAAGATATNADSDSSSNSERTNKSSSRGQNGSAPYWGDLPKGTDGGVYNTVIGHGSPADDHDEHHKLPANSAARRSVIAGRVADYPRGSGVYNRVVGHGSQDEESRRHSRRHSGDDNRNLTDVGASGGDSMFSAPLPDIPEERQKTAQQGTFADTQHTRAVSGFVPETAVGDDVRLLEVASKESGSIHAPRESQTTQHQRTFPLTATSTEDRHQPGESTSPSRYGAIAGVSGIVAGTSAHEYSAGHGKRPGSPRAEGRRRAEGVATAGPTHASPLTGMRNDESREESPKGEKKHKILGLFHRHKDDGNQVGERPRRKSVGDHVDPARNNAARLSSPNRLRKLTKNDAATERRRSRSSSRADKHDQSSHGKENMTAGAAGAAVVLNRLHHKNNSINERHQEPGSPVRGQFSTGAGEAQHEFVEISTPFEHPREPPMPPHADTTSHDIGAAGQAGQYNVLASGTPSGVKHTGEEKVSTGAAASRSTGKHMVAREAGASNTPKSCGVTPADGKARRGSTGIITQEPGNYNTLSSGTPSGIKHYSVPSTTTSRTISESRRRSFSPNASTNPNDDSTEYNVLPSGTPSGVKIKPRSCSRSSQPADLATHANNYQFGHGQQYNTLASGTASGVRNRDSEIPTYDHHVEPEMAHHMSPEVMPDAYTASVRRSSSQAYNQSQSRGQSRGRESRNVKDWTEQDEYHQYPTSQQAAKGMSPEVMPGTYTASVPRSSSQAYGQSQSRGQSRGRESGNVEGWTEQNEYHQYLNSQQSAKGMSPEVMPAAYTSSVHAPSQAGRREEGAAGQGAGRVVHKCQHCGGENDISEYIERAVRERF
ncbi:hypothetical protein N657DRAFT_692917 [Parathielavia appendiculata]|uniref:Uncharacterized protein n=1 Tax=Parathielavia appendiculata TaxID=2587402 RepID=A0AAN6TU12_9PEZI|nr:hypothetical protein N657DRAFT_692917 [Parathielavia appendiculata]